MKVYHIVQSKTGCFGATGTCKRVMEHITNKKTADKELVRLKRENENKHIMYWIGFQWA